MDFLEIARRMIGTKEEALYSPEDMESLRQRLQEIENRIRERQEEIDSLATAGTEPEGETPEGESAEGAGEDRVEEIRRSVTDDAVKERVERIGDDDGSRDGGEEE